MLDQSIVGRPFPPTAPYVVTEGKVREFAAATGATYDGTIPPTFPIVVAFDAMFGFLDEVGANLSHIIHGDQKFTYERPLTVGDELTATLTVANLRQIGGNDIISTRSELTDASGALVCTTAATLVHRGDA